MYYGEHTVLTNHDKVVKAAMVFVMVRRCSEDILNCLSINVEHHRDKKNSSVIFLHEFYYDYICFVFQAALICIIVTDVAFIKWYTVAIIIHMSFCIFVPIYPLIGCLITLLEVGLL